MADRSRPTRASSSWQPRRRDRRRHMTAPVALETPRLILRELRDDDAPAVHAYGSDADVVRYLDWGPNTPEDTARFLATARAARDALPRTASHLAIVLKTTGHLVGGCRIEVRNAASGAGDLGYVLGRAYWGQGYAIEAARALVGFGFESLALHRIWATCDVRNEASHGSSRRSGCGGRIISATTSGGRASGETPTSTPSSSRSGRMDHTGHSRRPVPVVLTRQASAAIVAGVAGAHRSYRVRA